ncbi:MAG: hypothetical protein P8Y53_22050 [Pseudolabrys sp.]
MQPKSNWAVYYATAPIRLFGRSRAFRWLVGGLVVFAEGDQANVTEATNFGGVLRFGAGNASGVTSVFVFRGGHVPARFLFQDSGVRAKQAIE